MADGFKFDGLDSLEKELNQTAKEIKNIPAMIVKTLSTVRNNILKTTISGMDLNGTAFEKYSKMYKDIRLKNSRQVSPVSLTYTGNMLRAMKAFKISHGGEIRFDSTRANNLAVKHNEGKGVPEREFFGLNQKNMDYIEKAIDRSITL